MAGDSLPTGGAFPAFFGHSLLKNQPVTTPPPGEERGGGVLRPWRSVQRIVCGCHVGLELGCVQTGVQFHSETPTRGWTLFNYLSKVLSHLTFSHCKSMRLDCETSAET